MDDQKLNGSSHTDTDSKSENGSVAENSNDVEVRKAYVYVLERMGANEALIAAARKAAEHAGAL